MSLLFLVSTETEISVGHYEKNEKFPEKSSFSKITNYLAPSPPKKTTKAWVSAFPSVDGNGKFLSAIMKKCKNVQLPAEPKKFQSRKVINLEF